MRTDIEAKLPSNFLAGDAPDYGGILNCMHCGLCQPTCPTFAVTGRERSSPRGRIQLMKGIADGRLELSRTFAHEMFFCLGCLACVTACPAGVPYGELLEGARAQVHAAEFGTPHGRATRRMALLMFERLGLLHAVARGLRFYEQSGLRGWLQRSGLLRLLGPLGEMEGLMPSASPAPSSHTIPELTPARGERRHRVGVLLGCVMDVFGAEENAATVRVLSRAGCEVVAPREAGCCGALHAHAGDLSRARRMATRLIEVFERADIDALVLNSAGCGAAIHDYPHWFHDDPVWGPRAAALAAKSCDLTVWLDRIGLPDGLCTPYPVLLTYHDACHLNHAQGVNLPPRRVLGNLPGVRYVELPEAGWCCGSAGVYNITHFETAVKLLERKIENIRATGASLVVTGNPGCLIQLQYGLRRFGLAVEAVHTATLLDRVTRGREG